MSKLLEGITRPGRGGPPEPFEKINPVPHSPLRIQNVVQWELVGPDGEVKNKGEQHGNIMCSFGMASLASMLGSGAGVNASTWISAMKIGTGTTAATSNDASLNNSTGSVVITAASLTNSNIGARTVGYQATFASNNPAGAAQIQEIGLFCNSTADSQCAAHTILTGANSVNKGASDSINVTYQVVLETGA